MKNILFTDLDETLLNENGLVSAYTQEILTKFTEAGNLLVLSSGRSLDSIKEVQQKAKLFFPGMYLIAYNGSLIYHCDEDKIIQEYRLPFSVVDYLEQKAKEAGIHIHTYTEHDIVVHEDDEEVAFYRRRIHQDLVITPHFREALTIEPHKMMAIDLTGHERLEQFVDSLRDWSKENGIQTVFSNPRYLEFFDVRAGKGNAVTYLCNALGIDRKQAYAAGDAENDISMLQAAGCGIAMKNADPRVKESANVITQYDNTQDGLAHFIASTFFTSPQ